MGNNRPVTAPPPITPPRIVEDVIVEILCVVPNFIRAISPVVPEIFAVLLPIFAPLVAPFLAIFPRAFQLIPTLVPILLEIIATLLPLFAPFVPSFTAVIDPVAPFVVAVLRPFTPVRSLFRSCSSFSGAWPIGWELTRTIAERGAKSGTSADTGGSAEKLPDPLAGSWEGLLPGRVAAFPRDGLVPVEGFCDGRVPDPVPGRLADGSWVAPPPVEGRVPAEGRCEPLDGTRPPLGRAAPADPEISPPEK